MTEQEACPAPAAAAMRTASRRWLILTLLTLGVTISFVDRTSLSAALAAPSFRHQFHLSDISRGWISSSFFWSYAILQVPLGLAVDRLGVKWLYASCFALWCVATAALGLVTGLAGLVALRLVVGAAEAVVVPATWRWIRNNFPEGQSGTAVGLYMLGSKIGPAIGTPLATALILATDWRRMFVIVGLAGLVWLVPWIMFAGERDAEPASQTSRLSEPSPNPTPLGSIFANPLIWGAMLINFCYSYFVYYCMTWMPAYLVEQHGLSIGRMGLYAFFSFAGIGIVALLAGWIADRLIERGHDAVLVRKSFTIAGFVLASTVVLGAHTSSVDMALFWNVGSLTGLGMATANHLALCRLTLIPASKVGVVSGIQQVAAALAGIVAPVLTGWLLHVGGSYTLPVDAILFFLVVGALATAFLLRPKWANELAQG